jgi:hypothetical protein
VRFGCKACTTKVAFANISVATDTASDLKLLSWAIDIINVASMKVVHTLYVIDYTTKSDADPRRHKAEVVAIIKALEWILRRVD